MLPGVGVFGTGEISKVLIPLLKEKGFHIRAIWSQTLKEAEDAAGALKITFYTNKIDDVLLRKDVDIVFVICQPFLHSEISVKALGIGKHVVCDKPMGLHQTDAIKMVRAAQYYPTLISLVIHPLRFLPAFAQMKRCLNDGIIGQIIDISLLDIRVYMGSLLPEKFNWMCDAVMGGGALSLVGSHVIDLISFLLDQRGVRVHGIVKTYTKTTAAVNGIRQISAPDFCSFQIEFANGTLVTASLHCHAMSSNAFAQEVIVYGSQGHLIVRGGDLFLKQTSQVKEEILFVDLQDLHVETSESLLPRPYIKGLCRMISALKNAFEINESTWVKEPVQAAASFEDGLYVHSVMEAIIKSNESKSWQRIEISSDNAFNRDQVVRFSRMPTM